MNSTTPLRLIFFLLIGAVFGSCAGAPRQTRPFVAILGTAQDGGIPQIGCDGPQCAKARQDCRHRRLVSCMLIADPSTGERWLIDATPNFPEQVDLANRLAPLPHNTNPGRPNLFDGILLTHAHIGHYTGLVHLGREVYSAKATSLLTSARMQSFLESNGPWSQLVTLGNVVFKRLQPGVKLQLNASLAVTPHLVPHRDEFSDTLAFEIHGPTRSILFLPDIDKWDKWHIRLEDILSRVDRAYIDGTFFGDGEIPGRAMSEIPHPFIEETMDRLSALSLSERSKVTFIHLNHTNPAADPAGPEAHLIRIAGYSVAVEGEVFGL